jgi:phenylalanyl-tRNA synthetase beta chain
VGANVREVLTLDDTLFTLKLTPNLAHCLSVYGIAREVSALTGAPLLTPSVDAVPATVNETLPVRVQAADLCGRFSGRVVRGINPAARTPEWMVQRLARCGQRSVSALVDISNYVMFEFGRPTHIFDLDKIHGGLTVRWAQEGESLKLLNGNTVALDGNVGVIADEVAVESLAGIMGGDATAVGDDTKNVYVEAAFWWPQAVAGRSRRYNFSTDAGHRFERGVDPSLTVAHLERITQLILEICGGQAGPIDDHLTRLPERQPVTLRVARASKVIGMPLTVTQCADVMKRLGLEHTAGADTVTVTPPAWRFDLQIEEDLIEEVARIIGYQNLPTTPPLAPVTARVRTEDRRGAHAVRHALADLDYLETINFSFVEERWERELAGNADPIRVLNPIAAPLAVMRTSLIGSLVSALRHNVARKASRVRLFEIGRVFRRDETVRDTDTTVAGVHQPLHVAGLAWGSADEAQWGTAARVVDFYDVKGDVQALLHPLVPTFVPAEHPALHPGRSARVELDGRVIGHVGELHPRWRQGYELSQAPVLFELQLDAVLARPVPAYEGVPKHPASTRDLAVVVGEGVTHDAVVAAVMDEPSGLIQSAHLFDVYRPAAGQAGFAPGERSLALRIELLDSAGTLTDERIEPVVAAAVERLASRLGARLRS